MLTAPDGKAEKHSSGTQAKQIKHAAKSNGEDDDVLQDGPPKSKEDVAERLQPLGRVAKHIRTLSGNISRPPRAPGDDGDHDSERDHEGGARGVGPVPDRLLPPGQRPARAHAGE